MSLKNIMRTKTSSGHSAGAHKEQRSARNTNSRVYKAQQPTTKAFSTKLDSRKCNTSNVPPYSTTVSAQIQDEVDALFDFDEYYDRHKRRYIEQQQQQNQQQPVEMYGGPNYTNQVLEPNYAYLGPVQGGVTIHSPYLPFSQTPKHKRPNSTGYVRKQYC